MFCKSCGNELPDGANVCPSCGAPVTPASNAAQPNSAASSYQAAPSYQNPMNNDKNTAATTSLVLGIASIVVAVLGGIMFGIFGALIAVILGIIAVVMGTNAKKATNGVKGTGGYTCGLIGLILGVIFAAGCGICGCSEPTGYTCYGCVGGSCKASNDVNNGMSELYDVLNDYDW